MIAVGDTLPPFALPRRDQSRFDWKPGAVTLFSFCAFWCDTWKEQSARIARTQNALQGMPVTGVTISVDGRWGELGVGKIGGTVLYDFGKQLTGKLGIHTVPFTIIVDRNGRVCHATQGITRTDTLIPILRRLVMQDNSIPRSGATGNIVYLTFDDFPVPEDDLLLDILRAQDAKATLFCIGKHLESNLNRSIVRRAVGEGHSLQLHSWSHDAANSQLERCNRALFALTQVRPTLYRPPGHIGIQRISDRSVLQLSTLTPYDDTRPGVAELLRRLSDIKPGSVLLLHAGVAETRQMLEIVLPRLRGQGFVFKTLG